jgi:hypothetical protein
MDHIMMEALHNQLVALATANRKPAGLSKVFTSLFGAAMVTVQDSPPYKNGTSYLECAY